MASTSIYFYEFSTEKGFLVDDFYGKLYKFEDGSDYFDVEITSKNEISGKFIFVKNIEITYFDPVKRIFDTRTEARANIIYFNIYNNILEIYGNKTGANRLTFILASLLDNVSINLIELSIVEIIEKLKYEKVIVNRVNFEDFIFDKDIIGNFSVDLSSYGEAFSVLNKYKKNVSKMILTLTCNDEMVKLAISSKGTVTIYKDRANFDEESLAVLRSILLKERF